MELSGAFPGTRAVVFGPGFGLGLADLTASYVWVEVIGLAGTSGLTNQSARACARLMGDGFLGVLALIAIMLGAVASNAIIVGPFANALKGADIAFDVGLAVAGVLY